jgi:hypothetical protein
MDSAARRLCGAAWTIVSRWADRNEGMGRNRTQHAASAAQQYTGFYSVLQDKYDKYYRK